MDRAARLRAFYARFVTHRGGARDPRIEAAFAAVPREPFAGPAPWKLLAIGPWSAPGYIATPDGDPAYLYQDVLVAIAAERGITGRRCARFVSATHPMPVAGCGEGWWLSTASS